MDVDCKGIFRNYAFLNCFVLLGNSVNWHHIDKSMIDVHGRWKILEEWQLYDGGSVSRLEHRGILLF